MLRARRWIKLQQDSSLRAPTPLFMRVASGVAAAAAGVWWCRCVAVGVSSLGRMENPLDADGVNNIFPVLAQSAVGEDGRRKPFNACRVAPTVTYIYQTKAHWYFSDPRDLALSTRLKKDLSNRAIIAGFEADDLMLRQHYTPKSDIIAVYIRSFRDPERNDRMYTAMMSDFGV